MSETESRTRKVVSGDAASQRPAVGIIATASNGNDVAAALLRAVEHDYDPLILPTSMNVEAVGFARQLDMDVVPPEQEGQDDATRWQALASAAREAGYPGLFRHADPSRAIDFDASSTAIENASDYMVDPVLEAQVDDSPDVLVAIPAYNEARTIADVVTAAQEVADDVVVVDDGSSDDTVERAREAGATVIEHETNKGYGGALKTAFQEAARADATHLAILDGDGQHDPSDVPRLVEAQNESGAEIVIGSRFERASETDLPVYRQLGLKVVNALTNLSLGVVRRRSRLGDTQSGFRVYDERAIASLAVEEDLGDHMGASTDVLYHAHRQGYEMEEVGTTIDYEVDNASSRNPVSHGLLLVNNILRTVERERPVTVLGIPGFASTVLGLGFAYATFANYIATSTFPIGLAIVSVFFTLAGIFAAFTAIILHSLEAHREN